ncbi:MAG: type II secretion system protein [Gallionellaceae bacterium]
MQISTAGKLRKSPDSRAAHERGFTYAMVLVAIVLVGIFAGVANITTSRIVQADREAELLFRGMAYRSAIQRYYAVAKRYPRSLDELLRDPRFAHRSYLRAHYPDPMMPARKSGESELDNWRLVRAADGGIAGVSSRSQQEPMKKANFPPGFEKFDGAKSYEEWFFVYEPGPGSTAKPAIGVAATK